MRGAPIHVTLDAVESALVRAMKAIPPALILLALAPFAAAAAAPQLSPDSALEKACAEKYASWYQIFARKECVGEIRRRATARICIKKDFPRMKALAAEVTAGLRDMNTLEEAKQGLETIMNRGIFLDKAKDNPREQVINQVISTRCDWPFRFAILLRAGPTGELKYLKMWLKDAPSGYPAGFRAEYSIDYQMLARRRELEMKRREVEAVKARARAAVRARHEAAKRRDQEAARKRSEAEAAKKARAEARRIQLEREAARKRLAFAPPPIEKDHCAPNITQNERIRRLTRFGSLRETRGRTFRAGEHAIRFKPKGGGLVYCN